jgi:hypothetical protein
MYVTAEEFLDMLHDIRERYQGSRYNLEDPQVMHTLLVREFPEVEGVIPPPAYETIRERYIPEEWRMAIPQPRSSHRDGPALVSGTPEDRFATTDPVEELRQQILADLDSLRSDPFCAMTYVVERSRGVDSQTAMNRGRAVGQVVQLVTMSSRWGIRATHRAMSGTTGRPRDFYQRRAEQVAEQEMVSRARISRQVVVPSSQPPTMARVRRRPSPVPSPERTRERLRRIAAQAGSPGSPRRR